MNQSHSVRFREVNDYSASQLSREKMAIIDSMNRLFLQKDEWNINPVYFFITIFPKKLIKITPPFDIHNFNVTEYCQKFIGINKKLSTNEKELCKIFQQLILSCKDYHEVKKCFGTLFEKYIFFCKWKLNPNKVYYNAEVFINNNLIKYKDYHTVDVAVDNIYTENSLEISECCLSIHGFERKFQNVDQINFYSHIFKEIRKELKSKIEDEPILVFELNSAYPSGISWDDLQFPDTRPFEENNVSVVGYNLFDPSMNKVFVP